MVYVHAMCLHFHQHRKLSQTGPPVVFLEGLALEHNEVLVIVGEWADDTMKQQLPCTRIGRVCGQFFFRHAIDVTDEHIKRYAIEGQTQQKNLVVKYGMFLLDMSNLIHLNDFLRTIISCVIYYRCFYIRDKLVNDGVSMIISQYTLVLVDLFICVEKLY